jgi:hypothetical protein
LRTTLPSERLSPPPLREKVFEVVGQAGSMAETRRMLEETQQDIDVAVIDLGLLDGYGGV